MNLRKSDDGTHTAGFAEVLYLHTGSGYQPTQFTFSCFPSRAFVINTVARYGPPPPDCLAASVSCARDSGDCDCDCSALERSAPNPQRISTTIPRSVFFGTIFRAKGYRTRKTSR